MKSLALIAALLAAPAAAAERTYSVTDFDRIQVEGPYEVNVVTGGPSRARATGDQTSLDRVSLEVQGRVLKVRANRSSWGGYPGDRAAGQVRIDIGTRQLSGATLTGSGNLAVDRARGLRLDVALSGSGKLAIAAVEADTLVVGLLGSGAITLAGKAKQMRATIQGSGNLDAAGLAADDATLIADSAGTIAFEARRTAKVTASGAGDVSIGGSASCTVTGPAATGVRCGR